MVKLRPAQLSAPPVVPSRAPSGDATARCVPGALLELAECFEARAPELALMLTRENGKTLAEAAREVGAAATFRHSAAQSLTDVGTAAEVAPGHYFSSLPEPVGVVAIIVPWNAPVALFLRSLGPHSPRGTPSRQSSPPDRAHQCARRRHRVGGGVTACRRRQHVHRVG